MHERCWALMTRILDVDLIEENLDLFVKVIRQQRDKNRLVNELLIDEKSVTGGILVKNMRFSPGLTLTNTPGISRGGKRRRPGNDRHHVAVKYRCIPTLAKSESRLTLSL